MSFFYNKYGDDMKIYLDKVFFINFAFDFMLLLGVAILLKRTVSVKRIICGALLGGLSIFLLFIRLNSIQLFILKLLISVAMIIITFSYQNIKYTIKNLEYLYVMSIFLGGALYSLNHMFSVRQEGIIFFHNGLGINLALSLILAPIILLTYLKQLKKLKQKYAYYYQVELSIEGKTIPITGFLDTGNTLKDPLSNKPIMIVNEKIIKGSSEYKYVPYETISGTSMLKCIQAEEINIKGYGSKKNVLLGLVENIQMDGIDALLSQYIMEEIYD